MRSGVFNLLPKNTVFYDLFEGLARHGVSCAAHLHKLASNFPNAMEEVQKIRQEEHDADVLAHQALDRLDRTFITPFDREDIHALVGELDSVVDNINALSKRLSSYHVKTVEPAFAKQTEILMQATAALYNAVKLLRITRKLTDLQGSIIEVHRLENLGDDNHLAALSKLFEGGTDPLNVIKWKEFFQFIETAIDGCEDATNVIERIVLKNG